MEGTDTLRSHAAEWKSLLAASTVDSVFLRPEWLLACRDTFAADARVLIPMAYAGPRLVAAAALQVRGLEISFLGHERADYCDVLVARDLDEESAAVAVQRLLESVVSATSPRHHFMLRRVPERSWFLHLLDSKQSRFHATVKATVDAPTMDMRTVGEKLRKKSLKRHENGLRRAGDLSSDTMTTADAILPHLDEFFCQHVSRWAAVGSIFEDESNREFYRSIVGRFDGTGLLRFTRLTLDGRLVAAHLGFLHRGVLIWYKPTFDITMSRQSPGEVLLKRVLEHARDEGAEEFDFTIGDEGYKMRFATEIRKVHDVHVTGSRFSAGIQRSRTRIKRTVERLTRRPQATSP